MEFSYTHMLVSIVGSFIFGAGVVSVIARYREYYLSRARRERYKQQMEFAKRENLFRVKELHAKLEDEVREHQEKLRQQEIRTQGQTAEIEARAEKLRELEEAARKATKEAELSRAHYRSEALRLTGLSVAEARKICLELTRQECEGELVRLRQEIIGRREEDIRDEARRVLTDVMQRIAPEVSQEINAAIVAIPNEEMKGRLIGREGRNIKSFEQATGTTLLIDETPDSVLVSSFDPVRREIARQGLEALIRNGRIHPDNIEHFVEEAREQVLGSVADLGRDAMESLGLPQPDPEIAGLLGQLHFRLSMNQNTLDHSIEVAHLSALIAAELEINPLPAKRAGLLHDIGKAMSVECGDSHAKAGAALLRRHGESADVVNAVAAHHGEEEAQSIYAPIIVLADKISASRPGARAASLEGYFDRMKNIEAIVREFPGVTEVYAVMAGRQVRVIVSPETLSEDAARETARKIRLTIEEKMQYPGSIHITLIREQRFHEEAK